MLEPDFFQEEAEEEGGGRRLWGRSVAERSVVSITTTIGERGKLEMAVGWDVFSSSCVNHDRNSRKGTPIM